MRTTITLDDDVFESAQAQALASGKRLGQILSDLARKGLKADARTRQAKSGLPVFDVAADAEVIPSDRASRILSKEP